MFEDKSEKDQLWTKLSMKIVDDIVKRRSIIAITNVSMHLKKQISPKNAAEQKAKLKVDNNY